MKVVTLLITVDLCCCRCKGKIQRVLYKLQRCEPIQEIVYDDQNDTVIVSGTFNPECLSRKLRSKACKVIKDIKVKPDPPPPEPPKDPPPKEEEKKPDPPPKKEEEKKPDPPPPTLVKVVEWDWPSKPPPWLPPSPCCCRPYSCDQAHHGCSRCCSCGKMVSAPPPPVPYYGGGGGHCGGVNIAYVDDPGYACNIM